MIEDLVASAQRDEANQVVRLTIVGPSKPINSADYHQNIANTLAYTSVYLYAEVEEFEDDTPNNENHTFEFSFSDLNFETVEDEHLFLFHTVYEDKKKKKRRRLLVMTKHQLKKLLPIDKG